MINPQKKDEECFKWAVIAASHHKETKKDLQRIESRRPYEKQYNWNGLEFPVSIKKINKFEKKNPGITVNMLSNNKKNQKRNIDTVRRSGHNGKCKKQVNLLMMVHGEKRFYTAIKNISKLLSKLNGKTQHAYNCLNGFRRSQQEISTMSTAAAMVTSRSISK